MEIADSDTYKLPAGLNIAVNGSGRIQLRAADGCRPTLLLGAAIELKGGEDAQVDLNGLLLAYQPPSPGAGVPDNLIHAPDGGANKLSQLVLTHCTVVPGWAVDTSGFPLQAYTGKPTLKVDTSGLRVVINQSIVGTLWINLEATATLTDSIVDAATVPGIDGTGMSGVAYAASVDKTTGEPSPGGALTMNGCTVIGKVYASLLSLVSDCILWAKLSTADVAASCGRRHFGPAAASKAAFDSATSRRTPLCPANLIVSAPRNRCSIRCAMAIRPMPSSGR